jgi:hypothetical protein
MDGNPMIKIAIIKFQLREAICYILLCEKEQKRDAPFQISPHSTFDIVIIIYNKKAFIYLQEREAVKCNLEQ